MTKKEIIEAMKDYNDDDEIYTVVRHIDKDGWYMTTHDSTLSIGKINKFLIKNISYFVQNFS